MGRHRLTIVVTLRGGFASVVAPPKLKLIHVPGDWTTVDGGNDLDT